MTRTKNFRMLQILIVLGWCLAMGSPLFCQSKAGPEHGSLKRLILKDGSYESINQYSIQGDRVLYFSTERHDWEELPDDMVDWPATEAYATHELLDSSKRRKELLDSASQERAEEEARFPTVAPGMRLPSADGVFLLDVYKAQPKLSTLRQVGADLKKSVGKNILRSLINPISSSRQTVELTGPHARIQSHVPKPTIYFSVNSNDPSTGYTSETAKDHLRIVRCREQGGSRIVFAFDIAVYGKVRQRTDEVETQIVPISNYWVKIVPAAPLQPGEYALVEVGEKGSVNEFVWDFGFDPAALPNPAVQQETTEETEPVLIKKPEKK
jgi:hypothetical protein